MKKNYSVSIQLFMRLLISPFYDKSPDIPTMSELSTQSIFNSLASERTDIKTIESLVESVEVKMLYK